MEKALGSNYETVMQYLDSKLDRDTLNEVFTKVTSVNFITTLDKRAKGLMGWNLELFKEMKSEIMSNLESTSET